MMSVNMKNTNPEPKKIMLGTRILIEESRPTLVEVTFGKQVLVIDGGTLKKLGETYVNMGNIAMFIDSYRLMLLTRGEPMATEHAKELMEFLSGMANPQANSTERRNTSSNGVQEIPDTAPPGNPC